MKLDLYFARRFFVTFLGVCTVMATLMTLIDFVEQISRFSSKGIPFLDIVLLTLLNTPKIVQDILPLVMILSSVTLFLALARSSELVVVRATGRSAMRTLVAPLAVATIVGVLAVAVLNPIVATTSKRFEAQFEAYRSGNTQVLSISAEGLWMRQADPNGQTVIRATRSNPDATVFYDVTFLSYALNGGPIRRIEAAKATLQQNFWDLKDATIWKLDDGLNAEKSKEVFEYIEIPSTLTRERIQNSFGEPSAVSIWDLPAYIDQLEDAGFSGRRHAVWFQRELARPLFLVAMVMVASAFTMRHTRFGRTGLAVLASIMMGFTLYYIRNFAQILGENGQIPIYLAAWAPPVASVFLALGLLLHMEDG